MTLVLWEEIDSPQWLDVQLRHRVDTVLVNCAHVDPPLLPALASAFAAYLLARRGAAREHGRVVAEAAASPRLSERVMYLGGLLRRAERSLDPTPDAAPLLDELGRLEAEAAEVLADIRTVVRDLPREQPAARRLSLTLIGAWGRYDDALAEARLRWRSGRGGGADLAVIARRRDVLLRNLSIARARSGGGLAYINGGRVQR